MSATASWASNTTEAERLLVESLRRFCRSVELCDDYLRGHYGMKIVSLQEMYEYQTLTIRRQAPSCSHHQPASNPATTILSPL